MDHTKKDNSDAIEDAADIATFNERMRDLKAGNDVVLPADVSLFITKGDSVLRAVRRLRDETHLHLSFKTDLDPNYISDLESGRKTGTDAAWRRIAKALDVPALWFGVKDGEV